MSKVYPQLIVKPDYMRHNVKQIADMCKEHGIMITGLAKGFNCIPECCKALIEAGCIDTGGSRIIHLKTIKEFDPTIPTFLCRIPMKSEAKEVVKWTDISLESELEVLKALDEEAKKLKKTHKVIIMKDIGDRREGFESLEELVAICKKVETEMPGLILHGVGANYNCYGSVAPTRENLQDLVDCATAVEAEIGRKLDILSTGGTTIVNLLKTNEIPKRINHIRVGIATITKADYVWVEDIPDRKDTFRLRAEIVELKDKPTMPKGSNGFASLNETRKYEDLGIRKRAIVAIGSLDIGTGGGTITPVDPKIRIWGSSCDHTLLDIEDCEKEYKVGDYIEFNINYVSCMYLTMSPDVNKVIVYD